MPCYPMEKEMAKPGASVTRIAQKSGRDYITPEDVGDALRTVPLERVRRDVLAVLAHQTDFGAEDSGLCAFVAWDGRVL